MKFILASQKLCTLISYSHSRHNGLHHGLHHDETLGTKAACLTLLRRNSVQEREIDHNLMGLQSFQLYFIFTVVSAYLSEKEVWFLCVYLPLNSELAMAPHGATGFLFFPLSLTNVNGSQSDEGVSKRRPSSWLSSLYKKKFKVYYSC